MCGGERVSILIAEEWGRDGESLRTIGKTDERVTIKFRRYNTG